MAYNLEGLVRILEQILHPDQQRWNVVDHKRPQIESLLEKASSLKQILGTCSPASAESLESQIRDAAIKAEDIIESHMVDQMLSEPGAKSFTISPPDLQQVIQELDAAADKLRTSIADGSHDQMPGPDDVSLIMPEPEHPISSKDAMVGLDKDMLHLKDWLTGDQRKLEITPIVGMGGIGKTTLARNLYNDPLIVSHFHTRAWATVSQEYNVQAILLRLLGCLIGKLNDEILKQENDELGGRLHKSLCGNRYLIVLDDMWSTGAWGDIRMYFPNQNNGSRIMVTTREREMAKYVDPSEVPPHHQMHLLDESESWNLLQQKVFGKDKCPIELEGIGKNIAANCRGLPLAIHVIGGLLSKAEETVNFWEHVAAHVRAAMSEEDEQVFNVLSLSYNHLPHHLKPCFLYMGVFPEDHEIRASKLIRLWVAEGFLKSNASKNLEEEAEDYLKALADRNLIVVTRHKSNGKAKSYGIHDLLRDLCIRKAYREKFLYVLKRRDHGTVPEDPSHSSRRVSVSTSSWIYTAEAFILPARSFLCIGPVSSVIPYAGFSALRLLRVLDVIDVRFPEFPTQLLQLVNLRYMASSFCSALPVAVSRLWNLQVLILGPTVYSTLPIEILAMPELRHLKIKRSGGTRIRYDSREKNVVHEKLQTLATVYFYPDLIGSIPNIKNLGIKCFSEKREIDLCHLHKLETLKLSSYFSVPEDFLLLPLLRFPPSLRKLSLGKFIIPWKFMTIVVSNLPNLEVLKIRQCVFQGQEKDEQEGQEEDEQKQWELTEEEFGSLRFLLLEDLELVRWRATDTNFPKLRHLVIRRCSALEEIPVDIGDILTLVLIEVDESSRGVVDSARKIKANQQELGNDDIEVRIREPQCCWPQHFQDEIFKSYKFSGK